MDRLFDYRQAKISKRNTACDKHELYLLQLNILIKRCFLYIKAKVWCNNYTIVDKNIEAFGIALDMQTVNTSTLANYLS